MKRRLAAPCLLAAALALGAAGCGERAPAGGAGIGSPVPDIELADLMVQRTVSLTAYRGRPFIINFWATWCEPCRREMPSLERLDAALRPHGVPVIGVTVDADANLAREFVLQYGLSFANFRDPDLRLARDALGINAFPATLLVGADGRIRWRVNGAREWTGSEAQRLIAAHFGIAIAPD